MTRVYAIRTGSYSDTSWGPVFSTIERALAYKDKSGEHEIEIEPHVLDDEGDTGPRYPSWLIVFDGEGNVLTHFQEGRPEPYERLIHDQEIEVFRNKPNNHWHFLNEGDLRVRASLIVRSIRAPDLAHAVKIASDHRAAYLSENR